MEDDTVAGGADAAEHGTVGASSGPRSTFITIAALADHDSPRTGPLDEAHVAGLAEVLPELPPVLVHRESLRVIDGRHRVSAAVRQGAQHVLVEFFEGTTEDAFVEAVRRNARHGLPLSLADRRAAALRILASRPHWSDGVVADHACLSSSTVAALRRSRVVKPALVRRGRDGRDRPVDGASRRLVEQFLLEHPHGSLREAARAADVAPSTAKAVRDAMRRTPSPGPRVAALRASRGGGTVAEAVPAPPSPEQPGPAVALPSGPCAPGPARMAAPPGRGLVDVSAGDLVQRLCRDPSVRSSEDGRALLRAVALSLALPLAPAWVPAHCRHLLVALAWRCADRWAAVASSLDETG